MVEVVSPRPTYAGGRRRPDGTYGAPRRFSLATILIVTTALAAMFGGLTALGAHPIFIGIFAGFIAFIGVTQTLLFHGRHPRKASFVGAVAFALGAITTILFFSENIGIRPDDVGSIFFLAIFSPIAGYLAGVMVAGLFLVLDCTENLLHGERDTDRKSDGV